MLITNQPGRERLASRILAKLRNASEVTIASAYVSPGACEVLKLFRLSEQIPVRLALGRAYVEGLPYPSRQYLMRLDEVASGKGGGVRVDPIGFHSKLYGFDCIDGKFGLIGSSNLTENGLGDWVESNVLLRAEAAALVLNEARRLYDNGLSITDHIDEIPVVKTIRKASRDSSEDLPVERGFATQGLTVSLLKSGEVPPKSGLNWGFGGGRPRNRYEAYIRFPAALLDEGQYVFGSNRKGTIFYANTHDGRTLKLKLQGTFRGVYGKQISTQGRNAELGEWMVRDCLGIRDARPVTLADLERYGRTDVTFYRTGTAEDGLATVYVDFLPRR